MKIKYHYFSLVFVVLSSFLFFASKPISSNSNQDKPVINANIVHGDCSKFSFVIDNTSNNLAKVEDIKIGNKGSRYSLNFQIMDMNQKVRYNAIPRKAKARLVVNFVNSDLNKVNCPEQINKVYIKMRIGKDVIEMTSYKIIIFDITKSDNSYAFRE